jgi:uncharacterized protein
MSLIRGFTVQRSKELFSGASGCDPSMPNRSHTFCAYMRDQYAKVFSRPWPVIPSALVVAALNVFLFAFDRPWTASDGIRNWGDWLLRSAGVLDQPDLLSSWLYSGSVLNLGLLFGGLSAALLSRQFGIRRAPAAELIKGALGGLMMGWGAMLAFGCNIGGFFSASSALSLSGPGMMAGLLLGAYLASRYLIWENAKLIREGKMPFAAMCEAPQQIDPASRHYTLQPIAGAFVLLAMFAAGFFYRQAGYAPQAVFLLFGAAFGIVLQRSRFCLVRAFREPFMNGESEHARAGSLALLLSLIGFTILKSADLKDASDWVFPSFWFGALVGGIVFGIGMVIAGGCGAGSIWRAGEGHIKLWVAVLFFAVGAAMMRLFLTQTELIGQLGSAIFLPHIVGWSGALSLVVVVLVLWYLVSGWNEQRKQAGVLKL